MGSPRGRELANWRSPAGWLLKGIITIYYRKGQRGTKLAENFRYHVSKDIYIPIIGVDVNDNAIENRGHKGTFAKNAFEHPDKHLTGMKLWPYAQKIVAENLKLTRAEIDAMATEAMAENMPLPIVNAPIVPEPNEESPGGYFYILAEIGTENCGIGISGNPNKRVRQHSKGDLSGDLIIYAQLYCIDPKRVEDYLKDKYRDDRIASETSRGDEKFRILPQAMLQSAINFCNRTKILYREVMNPLEEAAQ